MRSLESTTVESAYVESLVGPLLGGDAKQLRSAGHATLVGGDYRRRLAEATSAVVDLLQRASGRTITRFTGDWLFSVDRLPSLVTVRSVGVLSLHRPHLRHPPPPSARPTSLFAADGATPLSDVAAEPAAATPSSSRRSSKTSKSSNPAALRPHGFWQPPAGQWPAVKSSEAHYDRQILLRVLAKNAPPKYVPPPPKPRYAPDAVLIRHHLSKRDMMVDARGGEVEDPHRVASRPQTAAAALLEKTTHDSLRLDARLAKLEGDLSATLKRSLSDERLRNQAISMARSELGSRGGFRVQLSNLGRTTDDYAGTPEGLAG